MSKCIHPGYVSIFRQRGAGDACAVWVVDHGDYHSDSFGILATFENEADARQYADHWRRSHPVPEGFDDE